MKEFAKWTTHSVQVRIFRKPSLRFWVQPCTWIAFAARTFPIADFFVQFVAGWGALKLEAFRQRKPLRKRWFCEVHSFGFGGWGCWELIFFNEVTCDYKVNETAHSGLDFSMYFHHLKKTEGIGQNPAFCCFLPGQNSWKGQARTNNSLEQKQWDGTLHRSGPHLHCVLSTCCHVVSFWERFFREISQIILSNLEAVHPGSTWTATNEWSEHGVPAMW